MQRTALLRGHRLRCIRDQVQHHLLQLTWIAKHRREVGLERSLYLHPPVGQLVGSHAQRPLDYLIEVERLAARLATAREREQVLHYLAGPHRFILNDCKRVTLFGGNVVALHHELGKRAYGAQRIVDLVRHAGHQLTHSRQPLGLGELGAHLALYRHIAPDAQNRFGIGFGQQPRSQ